MIYLIINFTLCVNKKKSLQLSNKQTRDNNIQHKGLLIEIPKEPRETGRHLICKI